MLGEAKNINALNAERVLVGTTLSSRGNTAAGSRPFKRSPIICHTELTTWRGKR